MRILNRRNGGVIASRFRGSLKKAKTWCGVLPEALAERLGSMAGFRNVLVHGYGDLDLAVVEDIVTNRTGDLLEFVGEIRRRTR